MIATKDIPSVPDRKQDMRIGQCKARRILMKETASLKARHGISERKTCACLGRKVRKFVTKASRHALFLLPKRAHSPFPIVKEVAWLFTSVPGVLCSPCLQRTPNFSPFFNSRNPSTQYSRNFFLLLRAKAAPHGYASSKGFFRKRTYPCNRAWMKVWKKHGTERHIEALPPTPAS